MRSPSPTPRLRTLSLFAVLYVLAASLLVAAAWSVRSEAGDRGRHAEGKEGKKEKSGYHFNFDWDPWREDFSYAVIGSNSTINGGGRDWEDIQRMLDDYDQDLLWFSIRGKDYVVLDGDFVRRAKESVAPMNELGGKQGRLGARQGMLGGQQAAIGARQARIGARQAALSTRLAALAIDDREEYERDAVERELEELGHRMDDLARQHEPLARQQEELGRQQEELGRKMERLSKRVNGEIRELADEAVAEGKAQRIRE